MEVSQISRAATGKPTVPVPFSPPPRPFALCLSLSLSKLLRVPLGPQAGSKGVQSLELSLEARSRIRALHTGDVRTCGTLEVHGLPSQAHAPRPSLQWYTAPLAAHPSWYLCSQPLLGGDESLCH